MLRRLRIDFDGNDSTPEQVANSFAQLVTTMDLPNENSDYLRVT